MTSFRLGIDIGGTFTDVLLFDDATGETYAFKTPSTGEDPSHAVATGIARICQINGVNPADIRYFAHGTTLAVNTLLERNGAAVGALITRGFTDTLELRRLRLSKANDFFVPKPRSLVPRRHVRPIDERIRPDGSIKIPVRREDVEEQVRSLVADGVEAIAVCFLHSYKNDTHERTVQQWISQGHPDLYVCTSAQIWPQQREYERFLISVINAYVGQRMKHYFDRLNTRVRETGVGCDIYSTRSNGGVMRIGAAANRPVDTMLSGPASGVIGARHVAQAIGEEAVITFDMGGTSADISIVRGAVGYSMENTIGDFPVVMPAVDVSAVGAGGGSIAHIDAEGVLKVGPESAGSNPGPACYGRGGSQATVTDAYVVTGIVAPHGLLAGDMPVSQEKAVAAVNALATALNMTAAETADAILQVTSARIYAEIVPQIARRGVSPTNLSIIAYGAAGPTHVFMLARDLDVKRVIIPGSPGLLCAYGCLVADFRADFVRSIWRDLNEITESDLQQVFADLDQEAHQWMTEQDVTVDNVSLTRSADMCHVGQSYEVNTVFPGVPSHQLKIHDILAWFHKRYDEIYGYSDSAAPVRMLEARVQITGVTRKPAEKAPSALLPSGNSRAGRRQVHEFGKEQVATVLRREQVQMGTCYAGPLIIEQYDTTVWVPEEFTIKRDNAGNLIGERRD